MSAERDRKHAAYNRRHRDEMRAMRVAEKMAIFAATTDEQRDRAAILCGCRATDEATGRMWILQKTARKPADAIVFTADSWTEIERKLAAAAFEVAADRLGCRIGGAPILWAEAEAMIRCGWPLA